MGGLPIYAYHANLPPSIWSSRNQHRIVIDHMWLVGVNCSDLVSLMINDHLPKISFQVANPLKLKSAFVPETLQQR